MGMKYKKDTHMS